MAMPRAYFFGPDLGTTALGAPERGVTRNHAPACLEWIVPSRQELEAFDVLNPAAPPLAVYVDAQGIATAQAHLLAEANATAAAEARGAPRPRFPMKILWLLESRAYTRNARAFVQQHWAALAPVFAQTWTHDVDLIAALGGESERLRKVPVMGSWIAADERGVHAKTKRVSMVASTLRTTPLQRWRDDWAVAHAAEVDVFGRGRARAVGSKADALRDYAFSIAIENDEYDAYFTEKLLDCFACGTVPVYKGTRAVARYFDAGGILFLDDLEAEGGGGLASLTLERYAAMLPAVRENFRRVAAYGAIEDVIFQANLGGLLSSAPPPPLPPLPPLPPPSPSSAPVAAAAPRALDVCSLPALVLTTRGQTARHANLARLPWADVTLTYNEGVPGAGAKINGPRGHLANLLRALRTRAVPFVLLEDDVTVDAAVWEDLRRTPLTAAELPPDADALYIGVSRCSLRIRTIAAEPQDGDAGRQGQRVVAKFGSDLEVTGEAEGDGGGRVARVYNMLSTHGILVRTPAYAAALASVLTEVVRANEAAAGGGGSGWAPTWDLCVTRLQGMARVYALVRPLVYQDAAVGGQEVDTRGPLTIARRPTAEELLLWSTGPGAPLAAQAGGLDAGVT